MPALEPGQRVSHYVVVEKIGAGGMGEVYRARDDRLGRDVALKVLPPEVTGDPRRRQRFEREARALARLSHPNLLEIHDVGDESGVAFAVTELLEGETLRDRLRRGRPAWRKAAESAASIADGLAAAHAEGIVHRDLKPENVFVTRDGRVKILDFGLARIDDAPSAESETRAFPGEGTDPGEVLGTVGYMAPEQVRGEPADARSDIFALGCILYELLAGRRAFVRDTPAESMTAILREEPQELSLLNTEVPPDLERIVVHCLEKRPDERFQSARDLAFDLRSSSSGTESSRVARIPAAGRWRQALSVAVIVVGVIVATIFLNRIGNGPETPPDSGLDPDRVAVAVFENRTGNSDHDVLGKMAADWITRGLAETGAADVVPGMSSLLSTGAGSGGEDSLLEFADATGAGLVVSGAYYLQGETLAFHAKVTDVVEGRLIHAFKPIEGPSARPMEALEELKQRVMGLFAAREGSGVEHWGLASPPRFEAYSEYVAGLEVFGRDDARAFYHFQRASELDPDLAAPKLFLAHFCHVAGEHDRERAILAALLENWDRLSPYEQKWLDVGMARSERRYGEMLRLLLVVRDMAPKDLMANHWIGLAALLVNRPGLTVETFAAMDQEQVRGHFTGRYWNNVLSRAHHLRGDYESALEAARRGVNWNPNDLADVRQEVAALAALGRIDEVREAVERAIATPPLQETDAGDVMESAVNELRAHGFPDAAAEIAADAVEWHRRRLVDSEEPRAARIDLAKALYRAERWEEARALALELEQDDPEDIHCWKMLGAIAAITGDEEEARRRSASLAALDRPDLWGIHTYHRACIAALLDEKEQAVELLRESFGQGHMWYELVHSDRDLASLRGYPSFEELMRPRE